VRPCHLKTIRKEAGELKTGGQTHGFKEQRELNEVAGRPFGTPGPMAETTAPNRGRAGSTNGKVGPKKGARRGSRTDEGTRERGAEKKTGRSNPTFREKGAAHKGDLFLGYWACTSQWERKRAASPFKKP